MSWIITIAVTIITMACWEDMGDQAEGRGARGMASRFQAIALVAPPFLPLSARTLSSCPFNPLLFPSSFAEARSDAARRKLTSPRWYLASLSSSVSTWNVSFGCPTRANKNWPPSSATDFKHFVRKRNIRIIGTSEEIILANDCENGTQLIAVGLVSLVILYG